MCFEELEGQNCFVRTWNGNDLLEICVNVEPLGQRIPEPELSSLSRVVTSLPSSLLPVSIRGISQSVQPVLSDERSDGYCFVYAREFTAEVFLHCYRIAHQEIFGLLEVTTMVDFLMLRLRGALQQPRMDDLPDLRHCVITGRVSFEEFRLKSFVESSVSSFQVVKLFANTSVTRVLVTSSVNLIR